MPWCLVADWLRRPPYDCVVASAARAELGGAGCPSRLAARGLCLLGDALCPRGRDRARAVCRRLHCARPLPYCMVAGTRWRWWAGPLQASPPASSVPRATLHLSFPLSGMPSSPSRNSRNRCRPAGCSARTENRGVLPFVSARGHGNPIEPAALCVASWTISGINMRWPIVMCDGVLARPPSTAQQVCEGGEAFLKQSAPGNP